MDGRVPTMDPLDALAERLAGFHASDRPFVSLSYAQSLDGSLAAKPGAPTRLSGTQANELTHRLRAAHDAILVGIGTILADDPQLTVRGVPGLQPRPVVLDSRLRTPPHSQPVKAGTLLKVNLRRLSAAYIVACIARSSTS